MSPRRRNKKDKYGIYEIPNYQKKPVVKKKKKVTLGNIVKMLVAIFVLIILSYGVIFGIKCSMRSKALSLYEQEDYKGAIDLFHEALKPTVPFLEFLDNDVRFYLADCYIHEGQYGNACAEYNKIYIWNDYKEVEGLKELQNIAYGLQLYEWKEYREALPILLDAYESGYSELVLYVGSCYGQIGDTENMQLYYNVFLRNNEMNGFMYAQYAAIALDQDKLDEAYDYIQKGIATGEETSMKELLFDEIVYYEKLNDYNTAFEKASTFVELYPGDVDGKNEYDLLFTRRSKE
ncbi:MAG: tetratricopeptide repeat protein [Lachnospiraceae bacterium]